MVTQISTPIVAADVNAIVIRVPNPAGRIKPVTGIALSVLMVVSFESRSFYPASTGNNLMITGGLYCVVNLQNTSGPDL